MTTTPLILNKYWRDLGYCDIRIEIASDKLKYVNLKKQLGGWVRMRLSRYIWITHNGYIPSSIKVLHKASRFDDSLENLYTSSKKEPIEYRCHVCGSIHRVFEIEQAVCCANEKRSKPSIEKKKKRRLTKLNDLALARSLRKSGVSYREIACKLKMPVFDIKEMLRLEVKNEDGSVTRKLPFTDQKKISVNQEIRKGMKMTSKHKSYTEVRTAGLSNVSSMKKQVSFKQRERVSLSRLVDLIEREIDEDSR